MRPADGFRWSADAEGEWLCIRTPAARNILESLEPGKKYDFEVKPHREKRSLDANAYCWVLIGKLSAKLGIPPKEVYRQYIPDVGGNYHVIPIREELLDAWDKQWTDGHDGRLTVDMGPCRTAKGYHNIKTYFGSSDYDTRQMSRLIDLIVQDCKERGIETLTPKELDAMKSRWDEAYGGR